MSKLSFFSSKPFKAIFVPVLLVLIIGGSAFAGFIAGRESTGAVPPYILNPHSSTEEAKNVDFKMFWQAWNIIDKNFYGDKDNDKRLQGAISGMVAGLKDPYTVYLEPTQNKLFRSDLQGSFSGIGAELTVKNNLVTVVAALEGTPADKAGIRGQDVILEVDGKKTADLSFQEAIDSIRGEKGSEVALTLVRPGVEKPFILKIIRDTIVVKSVKSENVGEGGVIKYIKVNQFGDDTVSAFQAALQEAKDGGKKGVIIDLRNNPGGFLNSAIQMIGMLIPDKVDSTEERLKTRTAVLERHRDGKEEVHRSTTPPIIDTLPLVILVNGGSASASEILSGAMKDYKRATLVGTKTFGKGSVQDLLDLNNGGSIKVTIAKWFTPLGTGIDGKGIEPDVLVELPENTPVSTSDPQMLKAVEVITKSLK